MHHHLMRTDDRRQTDDLHRIWRADREAAKADALERSWLMRRRRRRREVRRAARDLVDRYGPMALQEAERNLHMTGLTDYQLGVEVSVYREVARRLAPGGQGVEETAALSA